jgi:hypothetical protein
MSVGDLGGAGHVEEGVRSPTIGGTSLLDGQGGGQPEYLLKARALYSCALFISCFRFRGELTLFWFLGGLYRQRFARRSQRDLVRQGRDAGYRRQ